MRRVLHLAVLATSLGLFGLYFIGCGDGPGSASTLSPEVESTKRPAQSPCPTEIAKTAQATKIGFSPSQNGAYNSAWAKACTQASENASQGLSCPTSCPESAGVTCDIPCTEISHFEEPWGPEDAGPWLWPIQCVLAGYSLGECLDGSVPFVWKATVTAEVTCRIACED